MASSTVGIGLTIGAVAQGSVGSVLSATRRSLDGLTRSSRALDLAQQRAGRSIKAGLATQQANYDRLGRALGRVRTAHDRLSAAAARSNAAMASGQQSWGKLAGTAMAAWGTIKGAVATAGQAADFADTLRDTRIKGRLSAQQESALGASIRANVSTTNQSRNDLSAGAHQLITGGASFEEVNSQIGLLGDTMTALRTSSEATTGAMLALRDMGATDRASMQAGLDKIVAIGEQGQFTPDMMIDAFAQLGEVIKTAGLKGDAAIAQLAAGLQVAEGAMGADGAKAGLQSWLSGLNDPKVAQAYERAGVDYKTSMAGLQKSGMSQYQASLELAGAFVRDSLNAQDQQALLQGDDDGRISAMLSEMGLGEVFKDANAARFALSIHNNKAAWQDMTNAPADASLAALQALRAESPIEQMKALKNGVNELALDIGNALLPALVGAVNTLTPLVAGIRDFVQANPAVVATIGSIVAGFVGFRVASVAGVFAFRQVMIVVMQGARAFQILRAGIALAQAQMALFQSGALLASGTLGGKFLAGLQSVGRVFMWLGRAFLMNPIGIAVVAIAGLAFVLIKYWEPVKAFFGTLWGSVKGVFSAAWEGIGSLLSSVWSGIKNIAESIWSGLSGFFSGLWQSVQTAFDGGLAGIGKLILDFSPLGLFYQAFAGVMDWFGIELPESFSGFGAMIIDGLVGGVTAAFTKAKDTIVAFGSNIKGWFSSVLGINSPSRVFMELGANVSEGAALGISQTQSVVRDAALGLAAATAVTLATPAFAAPGVPAAFAQGNAGSSMVIHFSPTIHVQDRGNVREQVQVALRDAYAEFRRNMQRYKTEESRRAMGNIGAA